MRVRLTVMVMAVTLEAGPGFAQDTDSKLDAHKKEAVRGVDEMAKIAQEMVDSVFSFGELGFQEVETSKYLTGQLEKFGFKVQRGVAGMPTAFIASAGTGQPILGILAEYDALPGVSQAAESARKASASALITTSLASPFSPLSVMTRLPVKPGA